jgi:hypothetical protein
MGNALVVGVIEKIGKSIEKHYLHSIEWVEEKILLLSYL